MLSRELGRVLRSGLQTLTFREPGPLSCSLRDLLVSIFREFRYVIAEHRDAVDSFLASERPSDLATEAYRSRDLET